MSGLSTSGSPAATASAAMPSMSQRTNPWRAVMAPYAQPRLGRALLGVGTSVLPYVALVVAMYYALDVSYWLTLALAVPAAGFLVRSFIVFHDCTHGSFLPGQKANVWVGRITGLLVYTPFYTWKAEHALHHATAGDLDRRGQGDIETLTLAEYYGRPIGKRLVYRLYRNPLIMFGFGPIWSLVVVPRFPSRKMNTRSKHSVMLTDLATAAMVAGLILLIGWQAFLLIQLLTMMLAGAAGIWLFYVQHQFEDAYWEDTDHWTYADAALRGSSYLKLPKLLQFFTGNIGLHHVHHLSVRVPNYSLQRAHDENGIFHDVPTIGFLDGIRATRLKLYDPERSQLVTWRQGNARRKARSRRQPLALPAG